MPNQEQTKEEWLEIQRVSGERDAVIYKLGADKARGLKATEYEVAKDNLGRLLNDLIKNLLSKARLEAKEEMLRGIYERVYDDAPLVKAYAEIIGIKLEK